MKFYITFNLKILIILHNCCLGIHENHDNDFKSLIKVKINVSEEKVSGEASNQCFVQIVYFYRIILILFEHMESYINKACNFDYDVKFFCSHAREGFQ